MPFTLKIKNIKIPQVARWRIAGVSDKRCAELMGMSLQGLARILATDEYKEYEIALMEGQISAMDRALDGKVDEIRKELRGAVPSAVRFLVDAVNQRRDMKTAFSAAREILDRDPDRTLPVLATEDTNATAIGVPTEILDAASQEGNRIAQAYAEQAKKEAN